EVLLIYQLSPGSYHIRGRALGNTTAASHTAGADVDWGDSYDMAIVAAYDMGASFTDNIEGTGIFTYYGWLMSFDSTQAYDAAGDRYCMHVTSVLGVFDAGAGAGGTNRCDAAQPNAVCVPAGLTDHVGAALSNPSLLTTNVAAGDVGLVR